MMNIHNMPKEELIKAIEELHKEYDSLKIKEKLEEDELEYKSFYKNAPIMMQSTDMYGNIISVNDYWLQMMGYQINEVIGTNSRDYLAGQSQELYNLKLAELIQSGTISNAETQAIKKNGEIIDLLVSSRMIYNSEGKPLQTITNLVDVSDKKSTERKLKQTNEELQRLNASYLEAKEKAEESEQKYKQLFDNTLDHIFILDVTKNKRFKIVVVNPIQEKEIGMLQPGKFMDECISAEIYQRFEKNYLRSIEEKCIHTYEESFLNYTFYTQIIPILNSHNEVYRLIGIAKNITIEKELSNQMLRKNEELKLAKEKAEESDQLKIAFIQNMSHEIRTPLNSIVGFSGMLNKAELAPEKRKSYTNIIINSSAQLLSIVSDILTVSALETKQEKVRIANVRVNDIIIDLLAIFKQQCSNHNISIYTRQTLNDKQSEVYTDHTKLTQILTNLLSNALKFIHKGFIEFGYDLIIDKYAGPLLKFYVKDTGIGINPEMQEKIFERFRQADFSINRKYGGTGLGLSISKGFVELLDGKIWLESEPKKGSTFYFTIPYKPVNEVNLEEVIAKQNKKTNTIILAEDEEYNYLFIKELLIDLNVKLIHAKNGRETVDICRADPEISLILMDIKMPELDGYLAAKEIKEFRPHLPIVAQSAYALEHEREEYGEIFDDYITKPIDENELRQKVIHYCRHLNNNNN